MLNYTKFILEKVSFDQQLFEKELRKNIAELIREEINELKVWCYEKFGQIHGNILHRCFS
jgi:hypothetical protein